jgi:hypothetical protein
MRLYSKTFDRVEKVGDEGVLSDLKAHENNPEEILRKMSIISEDDLEREFPLKD